MGKTAALVLVLLIFAGTLALAGGTRTMTDIKGPIFACGSLLLAVLALWSLLLRQATLRRLAAFAALAAAYFGYAALSALWASHPWIVKYVLADRFLVLVLALSVAVLIAQARLWRTVAAGYVVLGAAAACFAFYWHGFRMPAEAQLLRPTVPLAELRQFHLNDMRAPLGNANLLAALLIISLSFAAGFAVREYRGRRRTSVFVGLAAFALLVLPVLYYCRAYSYYIAICVAATVFVAFQSKRPSSILAAAAVIACVLGLAAWETGLVRRFMETKSYLVRVPLWSRAVAMTAERPVLGWGAGNYFTDSQPFAGEKMLEIVHYHEGGAEKSEPLYNVPASNDSNVHNEYLQELSEGGVIGLLIYLGLLASAIAAAFAAQRQGFADVPLLAAAVAAFSACLTANFFNCEIHFHDFGPHFWILAGLLAASKNLTSPQPSPVGRPAPTVVAAGCLAVVAAAYGVYTLAVEDYRSSLLFQSADEVATAYRRHRIVLDPPMAELVADNYRDSARLTWDPVLRARSLYLEGGWRNFLGHTDAAYDVFAELSGEIAAFLSADHEMGRFCEEAGLYEKALFYYRRHKAGHAETQGIDARIKILQALLDLRQGRLEQGLLKGRDYFIDFPDDRQGRRTFVRNMLSPEIRLDVELDMYADDLTAKDATGEDFVLAGVIKYLKGDPNSALPLLEKSRAAGYKGRDLYYYLARAYIVLNRLDDARKVIAEGKKVNPECRGITFLAAKYGVTESAPEAPPPPVAP